MEDKTPTGAGGEAASAEAEFGKPRYDHDHLRQKDARGRGAQRRVISAVRREHGSRQDRADSKRLSRQAFERTEGPYATWGRQTTGSGHDPPGCATGRPGSRKTGGAASGRFRRSRYWTDGHGCAAKDRPIDDRNRDRMHDTGGVAGNRSPPVNHPYQRIGLYRRDGTQDRRCRAASHGQGCRIQCPRC
jgi:hypothetical protein